ncbi:MAG: 4Fe-4S binding protein [Muribaculaceae bacterium]|nr:4Fe-4S binding protein [Muribaculaceae bacterium]
MKSHSLKYLRIAAGLLVGLGLVLLFADFTGAVGAHLAVLAKIQLVPALLAANLAAIALLAALTLIFGRIYCSVICPLGIMQDCVAWLRRVCARKNKRRLGLYRYEKSRTLWRAVFLVLFIIVAAAGLLSIIPMSFAGLLDPYSIFGRIASQIIVPAWRAAADSLGEAAAARGSYPFASVPSWQAGLSLAVGIVAALSFVLVAIFAWRTGRGYCNTVCPVGSLLGLLSRFSLLRPIIDTSKCTRCGSCGRHCKAKCIDTKNHRIDLSRCVVCMDCINNCSEGAISYGLRPKAKPAAKEAQAATDAGRRSFLVGTAIVAGAAAASAADKFTDGGLAPLKKKQRHTGSAPAVPPGAVSLRHFRSHCTACQLCVSRCPNEVLKPSTAPEGFMQPVMVFTDGFCRPECTACGEVCPTGAIKPIDAATKSSVKTGTARVDTATCISAAYGQACGNCSRHCPAGAITMVKGENGNRRPAVDESRCIGCGSCEYHCPCGTAGQLSTKRAAIYVEGASVHSTI